MTHTSVVGLFSIVLCIVPGFSGCREFRAPLPITKVDFTRGEDMKAVTAWRIAGPFSLPADSQAYTEANETAAFMHDYLPHIRGKEMPLQLSSPTTNMPINLDRENSAEASPEWPRGRILDQIQAFPSPTVSTLQIYGRLTSFAITYAAVILDSPREADVAFVVSGDSPVKVWLNDAVIVLPSPGTVGYDWATRAITRSHLRKGKNTVLVKLFCFHQRNDFAFRIATIQRAERFIKEQVGLPDVLDRLIVPEGASLHLSGNLRFFQEQSGGVAKIELFDVRARLVSTRFIQIASKLEVPTTGLHSGLYSIRATVAKREFLEDFFLGDTDALLKQYRAWCNTVPHRTFDPCVLLSPLTGQLLKSRAAPRLDVQKPAVRLISQIEWNINNVQVQDPGIRGQHRMHLIAFRSSIDGQLQYYYLHLPSGYGSDGAVPLVIVCPYNTSHESFLTGPPTTLGGLLQAYADLADEFGYAVLLPFARGSMSDEPLATADILESLADVQKHYTIDENRIYLNGYCGGGRTAIVLAERFPDRFAAVSTVAAATSTRLETGSYWSDANNPLLFVQNLQNIPLRLIHGDFDPHSPTDQAYALQEQCRKAGINPELILLPRDAVFAEVEPLFLAFQFFKDKTRASSPLHVSFTTAQLSYDHAYWVRIRRLNNTMQRGSVDARWEGPNKIILTTTNVSRLFISPMGFPAPHLSSKKIIIYVNSKPRTIAFRSEKTIDVKVNDSADPEISRGVKAYTKELTVADVFARPFLLVTGTGGEIWQAREASHVASEIAKAWQDNYFTRCRSKQDRDVAVDDIDRFNLILVGKIAEGLPIARLRDMVPLHKSPHSMLLGDQLIHGTSVIGAAVYPNPSRLGRYLVAIDFNGRGDLSLTDLARRGGFDASVWQLDPSAAQSSLVQRWYWDNEWKHLMPEISVLGTDGNIF